ncbi:hypothetical protein AKN92_11470 [Thiopseudomonas alkaliphila]|nr:hypothetical protein AKN92_11470 [Thiopseudomonas alkaliphila]
MFKVAIKDLAGREKKLNARELRELVNRELAIWDELVEERARKLNKLRRRYKPSDEPSTMFDNKDSYLAYGSYSGFNVNIFNIINSSDFNDKVFADHKDDIRSSFNGVLFSEGIAFQGLKEIYFTVVEDYELNEAAVSYLSGLNKYSKIYIDEASLYAYGNNVEYFNKGFTVALAENVGDVSPLIFKAVDQNCNESTKILSNIKSKQIFLDQILENAEESLKEKIEALEKTYEKYLKLAEPRKYWKELSKKHIYQGWLWVFLTAASILGGCKVLFDIFIYWSEQENKEISFALAQSTIFIMLGTAAFFYFIKLCTKMIFSSFHLARDAEEREQLTSVYLSLIKEGSIESDASTIILQALFSRTDTGLLGGDSSPTMPAVDVFKMIKTDKGLS